MMLVDHTTPEQRERLRKAIVDFDRAAKQAAEAMAAAIVQWAKSPEGQRTVRDLRQLGLLPC